MQNLVIVESPTKSKTLALFLGNQYRVEASMGHIRDLPKSEIGVDVTNNFAPKYIVAKDKTKIVKELKKLSQEAKTLWLATDPDREGEAIAWHIAELLRKSEDIKRVVFHEITPEAIKEAFAHPREINLKLVDAQQARRILDRLVGYKLSPLLWKKVKSGLSAGRVQSAALRLVVEREREIITFLPKEYWSVEAELSSKFGNKNIFTAAVVKKDSKKVNIKNQAEADKIVAELEKAYYSISQIDKKEVKRYPAPPFTTSTLQQTASLHLGLSAKKTMIVAQALYEHGLITYMRTDSVNLSSQALSQIRNYLSQNLDKKYLPKTPRFYKAKSKLAQEAHEAIRPTEIKMTADKLKNLVGVTRDHLRVYDLIWKRAVACQMAETILDQTSVEVKADCQRAVFLLKAAGSQIKFDGWLKLYGNKAIGEDEENKTEQVLPKLQEGEELNLIKLLPKQHFSEPPPRYNEASLIKKLEELGIGRPSTYAPILSTIQGRFYVEKQERKFLPTPLGLAVTDFLLKNFPDIVDFSFTAQMEDELDRVALGERNWQKLLAEFYLPFEKKILETEKTAAKVKLPLETTDKFCPRCGKNLVVRFGKFGKFLACLGFPDCQYTEGIEEKVNAWCPDCKGEIVLRKTRKGRIFYGCKNWPNCKFASWTKPKSETKIP